MQEGRGCMESIWGLQGWDSSAQPGGFTQNSLRDGQQARIGLLPEGFSIIGQNSVAVTQGSDEGFHERQFTADGSDGSGPYRFPERAADGRIDGMAVHGVDGNLRLYVHQPRGRQRQKSHESRSWRNSRSTSAHSCEVRCIGVSESRKAITSGNVRAGSPAGSGSIMISSTSLSSGSSGEVIAMRLLGSTLVFRLSAACIGSHRLPKLYHSCPCWASYSGHVLRFHTGKENALSYP